MLRSMYSGISGLKNFQTKLDVIGNNIANVNTFGFKKSRVTFADAMNQTISGASAGVAAGQNGKGGTNAIQVGLGSSISSIDKVHDAGSLQSTNRLLDVSISGDGYYVVNDGQANFYTRSGNFYLDDAGTLVTSDGMKVQGQKVTNGTGGFTAADPQGNLPLGNLQINDASLQAIPGHLSDTLESFSIGQTGEIYAVTADGETVTMGRIALATFNNTAGLSSAGGNIFQKTENSGEPRIVAAGANGTGDLASGMLEMSNVDLAEEFTEMIVAQRGFQANTRIITTSDEILQELVNLKR
jgi:flagellar hook protein FlgE